MQLLTWNVGIHNYTTPAFSIPFNLIIYAIIILFRFIILCLHCAWCSRCVSSLQILNKLAKYFNRNWFLSSICFNQREVHGIGMLRILEFKTDSVKKGRKIFLFQEKRMNTSTEERKKNSLF